MRSLPVFMRLNGCNCLVVGGGIVAWRKVRLLLKTGAHVTVVSPEICHELSKLSISHITQPYCSEHLQGMSLVIVATDDETLNQQVAQSAQSTGIPVNVVDNATLSTVTFGAIVDRDPLLIAISTGGDAPVLARQIRNRIATLFSSNYGRLVALMGQMRDEVKHKIPDQIQRRKFWETLFTHPAFERLCHQPSTAAYQFVHDLLTKDLSNTAPKGEVYLVGGGPGDPDLLTVRALYLLQHCDVCVYDKLISPEVLSLVRMDAERIYVGKSHDQHTLPQAEINQLLIELAQQGKRVVRLKGGDPFIFGRGGEEIETLMAQNINFQVVPGITAANGVACYAGIPLTHRDYAQACLFITGHLRDGKLDMDWTAMLRPHQTLVIYMGVSELHNLCQALIQRGLSPTMPAAIVEHGTTRKQRVLVADVSTLAEKALAMSIKPPALTIIGEVVKLHQRCDWFHPDNPSL